MGKAHPLISAFNGGEVSPLLDGRADLGEKYNKLLKKCENFLVTPQGPLVNRPGFKYIAGTKTNANQSRLIPFRYSDEDAYVLEFGDLYIRFHKSSGTVQGPDTKIKLLIHAGDSEGDTTPVDSSATAHAVAGVGGAEVTKSTQKFGSGCLSFGDGAGDYFSVGDNAEFNVAGVDWTIDCWVKPIAGNSQDYMIFAQDLLADATTFMRLYLTWFTGLLLHGNGTNYSTTISDSSMNTKTLTRDGNTSLLLHGIDSAFAETQGSADIYDSSPTSHTVSVNGSAAIDTNQSKFGGSSLRFNGSTDFIDIDGSATHTEFDFSGGIWTIECFVRFTDISAITVYPIWSFYHNATNFMWLYASPTTGKLNFVLDIAGSTTIIRTDTTYGPSDTGVDSSSTFHHIVVCESGNNYYLYLNGVRYTNTSTDRPLATHTNDFAIAYSVVGGASYLDCYIDEFRVLKGVCLYSVATITVPTGRFSAVELDTSDPQFGTGAIRFGGQDYLTHAGSSDFDIGATGSSRIFTVEMFVKPMVATGSTQILFQLRVDANNILSLYIDTNGYARTQYIADSGTVDQIIDSSPLSTSAFTHIALVGDGTNLALYVGGTRINTIAFTADVGDGIINDASGAGLFIGAASTGNSPFAGLIDDFKFGLVARYSGATLTVPTAEDNTICHAKFEVQNGAGSNDTLEDTDDRIATDDFYHIEVGEDFSDADRFLYTNGLLVARDLSVAQATVNLDSSLYIGIDPDVTNKDFKGYIDEFRFYSGGTTHDTTDVVGTQVFISPTSEYGTVGSSPLEVTTTYVKADVFDIKYAQSGDVLYLAHPSYAPRKLVRISDDVWKFYTIEFFPEPIVSDKTSPAYVLTLDLKTIGDHTGGVRTFTDAGAGGTLFATGDVGKEIREKLSAGQGRATIITRTSADAVECDIFQEFSSTSLASGKWDLVGSSSSGTLVISNHLNSGIFKVLYGEVVTLTANLNVFVAGDVGKYITTDDSTGAITYKITNYTSATVVLAVALEESTYASNTMAIGEWEIKKSVWGSDADIGYPSSVTFFENRLIWAGSTAYPDTIWGSVVDDYESHLLGTTDASAYSFTLASKQVNKIQWIEDGESLFIGSSGAEWILGARGSSTAVTATNVDARIQTSYGSANVQPIKIGQEVIFVQDGSKKIRDMIFTFETDAVRSDDLNILSEHIAQDGIKQIDFQLDPYSTVWCITNDGNLIGMTFLKEQEVIAWHKHTTGLSGTFESVAVIPNVGTNRDEVWCIVNRSVNSATVRYIEKMDAIFSASDLTSAPFLFMDCGKTYANQVSTTLTGLSHLEGEIVKVVGDGLLQTDKTVSSGSITIDTLASSVSVGVYTNAVAQLMRLEGGAEDGTAQGRTKKITDLTVRFYKTYNAVVGPSETDTDRIDFTAGSLFSGDKTEIDYPEGYETDGNITIIQDRPFPCTILAVIPNIDTKRIP